MIIIQIIKLFPYESGTLVHKGLHCESVLLQVLVVYYNTDVSIEEPYLGDPGAVDCSLLDTLVTVPQLKLAAGCGSALANSGLK